MNENSTCYFFQFGRKVAKHFRASYMYGSRLENKVELCIARIVIRVIWKILEMFKLYGAKHYFISPFSNSKPLNKKLSLKNSNYIEIISSSKHPTKCLSTAGVAPQSSTIVFFS